MSELAYAWAITLVVGGIITVMAAFLSRVWRRHDAEGWHGVYSAIVLVSLGVPVIASALPSIRIVWHSWDSLPTPDPSLTVSPALMWWLAVAYVSGVALSTTHVFFGLFMVRQLRQTARVPQGQWVPRLASLNPEQRTQCRWHRRVQSPVTIGAVHPLVILPETALCWPEGRLRAVLQHEFAHVSRRDYLWNLIAVAFRVVYWPSPAAWWLVNRARLAAELACDRRASAIVGDSCYMNALLDSAREFSARGRSARLVAPGAVTHLYARLEALVGAVRRHPKPMPRVTRVLMVGAVAVLLTTAAMVRVVTASPQGASVHAGHMLLHAIRH
jgi:beta-lactamase regulating signal transducer with metallopeptidase domain